ncbi:MAG: thiamine pyrophosphate-dependent dehydrogenase E1 component subunit alpha [Dehalococcoidales bacterium]|nr:thiamine pyrophosphate-dependent dehydrogenase E1 component subunit alpha [Dehalococcoidales bacterium]
MASLCNPEPIRYPDDGLSIPADTLRRLYTTMLRIRKVQSRIVELYHEDEMKTPVHLYIGEEAVAAGVCENMALQDYVFSNHRGHGHYIAKGGDLKAMIAELYNRETGCSRGRGGSMHLIDTSVGLMGSSSIVGGSIPLATGAALTAKLTGNGRVAVSFFGDAASEEGVLYESINFAVLKKLPVIFVCENNRYSVYSPMDHRQAIDDLFRKFEGLSIPSYQVDGNNVIEVYKLAAKVIKSARENEGPAFIECRTYRLKDHHGTGNGVDVGYRSQEEVDAWTERCPIAYFERYLVNHGIISKDDIGTIAAEIDEQVNEAFSFARSSPLPDPADVLKYLYS